VTTRIVARCIACLAKRPGRSNHDGTDGFRDEPLTQAQALLGTKHEESAGGSLGRCRRARSQRVFRGVPRAHGTHVVTKTVTVTRTVPKQVTVTRWRTRMATKTVTTTAELNSAGLPRR
jgi:hypothetical protein